VKELPPSLSIAPLLLLPLLFFLDWLSCSTNILTHTHNTYHCQNAICHPTPPGDPIVFDHVKGAYIWDVDGNQFIDYILSWGPAILGHANDQVLDAVKATLEKGTR
jgi:glutamate-1-semialdehyde aminotransferase